MACETADSLITKKVIWFFESNENSLDDNPAKEWTRYSDFESEFIEQAFHNGKKNISINDFVIDFETRIQIQKGGRYEQRQVKRDDVDNNNFLRQERFSYPKTTLKTFQNDFKLPMVNKWLDENKGKYNSFALKELAAQGELLRTSNYSLLLP